MLKMSIQKSRDRVVVGYNAVQCRGERVLCFLQCGGEEGCTSYSEDVKRVVFLTVWR